MGRLAKSFRPPPRKYCRSAEVLAIVGWSREASDPDYRDSLRSDSWEVIVPELVFKPDRPEANMGAPVRPEPATLGPDLQDLSAGARRSR